MKFASVLLAAGCLLSAASAQWLETSITLPGGACPCRLSYNDLHNKIYCTNLGVPECYVIDGDTNVISRVITVDDACLASCYNPIADKAYLAGTSTAGLVFVVDGTSDSVIAAIPLGYQIYDIACSTISNKVYCALGYPTPPGRVVSLSGSGDSVLTEIPSGWGANAMCYSRQRDAMYVANYTSGSVGVIGCGADTVLARIDVGYDGMDICYDSIDDKVYDIQEMDGALSVIDCAADTVRATLLTWVNGREVCYNAAGNKVYISDGMSTRVLVVDCCADTLLRVVQAPGYTDALFYQSANNKVYVGSGDCVLVLDGITDTVVAQFELDGTVHDFEWNPLQNRVYVATGDNKIWVIRDSMPSGVGECLAHRVSRNTPCATIVRRILLLPSSSLDLHPSSLLDVSGRKVTDLHPGANDVSGLAPGVYFVRPEPSAASREPSAVTKVVVTR